MAQEQVPENSYILPRDDFELTMCESSDNFQHIHANVPYTSKARRTAQNSETDRLRRKVGLR